MTTEADFQPHRPITEEQQAILDQILQSGAVVRASSLIDKLSTREDGLNRFEQRSKILDRLYMTAIGRTRPTDWILSKDNLGAVTAMIAASGARLVNDVYEIELTDLRPLDEFGMFAPIIEECGANGEAISMRGACTAICHATGRSMTIEITRRGDEDFAGRTEDQDGRLALGKGQRKSAWNADLRAAVLTGLETKAARTLASMSRVPPSELERAWQGTEKSVNDCRKGSGYGSSAERVGMELTPDALRNEQKQLGDEVLRVVGGDVERARALTKRITSSANFTGFESMKQLTKEFQVKQAWKNLKASDEWRAAHAPQPEPEAAP